MLTYIFLYTTFIFSVGCSKDKKIVTENSWQVESIKSHADSLLSFPPQNNYVLEFKNKKNYSFKIGSNTSSGEVSFGRNNTIEFDGGITFAMWDNEFSEKVFAIFSKVNKYESTETTLVLMDDNGRLLNFKKM